MYIPKSFAVDDPAVLIPFMRQYSFATLVGIERRGEEFAPFATHLPLLVEDRGPHGTLVGHLAKANPQWRCEGCESLAIFHGPHAYVSPTWYATQPAVPTWNYAVVHAYGKVRWTESPDELLAIVSKMAAFYESSQPQPWDGIMTPAFREPLLAAIVGFEIELTRVEGKFKLNQNRSEEDQRRVIERLSQSPRPEDQATAALMQRGLAR